MGNFNIPVIYQSLLEVTHVTFTGCSTVARMEGHFRDQITQIDSGGEGPKSQDRPLHPLSEYTIWAIPRWRVFIPPNKFYEFLSGHVASARTLLFLHRER